MNILRANCGKGKILRDLGELNNFHCIYDQQTNQNYCSFQVILRCYSYESSGFVQGMWDLRAIWHGRDIFSNIDDKYDYWKGPVEYVHYAPVRRKRVREKYIPVYDDRLEASNRE